MTRQVHPLAVVAAVIAVLLGVWAVASGNDDTTQVVVVLTPTTTTTAASTSTSAAPALPATTATTAPPATVDQLGPYLADQYPRTDPLAARQAIEQTCAALDTGSDPLTGPAATAGLLPMAYPDLARRGVAWLCPQHLSTLDRAIPRPPG